MYVTNKVTKQSELVLVNKTSLYNELDDIQSSNIQTFNDYTELFIIVLILIYLLIKFILHMLNRQLDQQDDNTSGSYNSLSGNSNANKTILDKRLDIDSVSKSTQTFDQVIESSACNNNHSKRSVDECLQLFNQHVSVATLHVCNV